MSINLGSQQATEYLRISSKFLVIEVASVGKKQRRRRIQKNQEGHRNDVPPSIHHLEEGYAKAN